LTLKDYVVEHLLRWCWMGIGLKRVKEGGVFGKGKGGYKKNQRKSELDLYADQKKSDSGLLKLDLLHLRGYLLGGTADMVS
jgi:hypothetical protein